MADLIQQIDQARQHGYSDQEISDYLQQSHPDLAPKIKEALGAGYSTSEILGHLAPSKPPEQSPLSKAASAFWQGIGGQAAVDILGGASRDPARAQRATETVKGLVEGIRAEPGRVWRELSGLGQSMLNLDVPGMAWHAAGAMPLLGAPAQQVG